jgi:predicted transcriptional regulator
MRITIDLPDDLHRQVLAIARDTSRTLSQIITELMRRGLGRPTHVARSTKTGLPVVTLGKVVTTDEVRLVEDDR